MYLFQANQSISEIKNFPKEKIWLFNSGESFEGNVKYLFLYIVKNRTDIFASYIVNNRETINYIRSLGYRAHAFQSDTGLKLMQSAGVYVNENVKEDYPNEIQHAKILNLFHGVGLKSIERKVDREFISLRIAKKYIKYNSLFMKNMCFLVTSPFMEKHFKEQLNLNDSQIIRAGYPRCTYHVELAGESNIFKKIIKLKSNNKKIFLYVPTFREKESNNFLYKAIPNLMALLNVLNEENIVLIIKLHKQINRDFYFNKLKQSNSINENLILWDNKLDIYEIFRYVDTAIIDYSSIYYDLILKGVSNFIRYIFDYDNEKHYLIYDYFLNTTGIICHTFTDLLNALKQNGQDDSNAINEIKNKFWSYACEDDCNVIIDQTLNFSIEKDLELPILYSFDIFDTLISRQVLRPDGIFYYVMEKITTSNEENFPYLFKYKYPEIRIQAESNVREYIKKTEGNFEITFDAIFERLKKVYSLSDNQINLLKNWEIEAEYNNVTPIKKYIELAENLVAEGNHVVLISDMYLPLNIIRNMILKVSEALSNIQIFVSSEYHVQKTTKKLYYEVYKSFDPYIFKEWNHYGDNPLADIKCAKEINIIPHYHSKSQFNEYEEYIVTSIRSYDAFLLSAMICRYRVDNNLSDKEYYAFAHLGSLLVPYIAWVIENALQKDLKTLYFISRDGFVLKQIADEYIKLKQIKIKTKYIYGSRKAWRLAGSSIEDDRFFSYYGNFSGVRDYSTLLDALEISNDLFQKFFPELNLNENSTLSSKEIAKLKNFFKNSELYKEHFLKKSRLKRELVIKYIKQEIDLNEKHAFVEFWGRGYTQTVFGNILNEASGEKVENIFYYYRSILPDDGYDIRCNYSTQNTPLIFCEAIFANHPYSSILSYKQVGEKIEPVRNKILYDKELFEAIKKHLPKFVRKISSLDFIAEKESLGRLISTAELHWYDQHQDDPVLVNSLGHLLDNVSIQGNPKEFAPQLSFTDLPMALTSLLQGKNSNSYTSSIIMSLCRSDEKIKNIYRELLLKTRNLSDESAKQNLLKQSHYLHKLKNHPLNFLHDSSIPLLRFFGRYYSNKIVRGILNSTIIPLVRRIMLWKFYKKLNS